MLTLNKLITKILISLLVLLVVIFICSCLGTTKNFSILNALKGPGLMPGDNSDYEIFILRLQRVIIAALVGAALAGAGATFQALLRNPLADPYILGISSGAGLGAVTAIVLGIGIEFWAGSATMVFAFTGAILTISLVWYIGSFTGKVQPTGLLLAGVVINAFFSSIMMFLISIAKSEEIRSTVYWLMGNIKEKGTSTITVSAVLITGALAGLFSLSHSLNAITLGEKEAAGLGVNIAKVKKLSFGLAAFITAVAVSISGLIGFAGLIVPHAVRLIFGPDHRQLLPISAVAGAIFLVIADTIARTIFGQEQLPVGVITALVGGPFFLFLLARFNKNLRWLK